VVQVKSIKVASIFPYKAVTIKAASEILCPYERVGSYKPSLNVNISSILSEVTDFHPYIANIIEIKLVGRVLTSLKHMSNYTGHEVKFGVIDKLHKVGCDNFIVAKSSTIHQILHM
jgi:hypothetical protein